MDLCNNIFKINKNYFKGKYLNFDKYIYQDLDFFDDEEGLYKNLDNNFTILGKTYLKYTLLYPITKNDFYQEKYLEYEKYDENKILNIKNIFKKINKELDNILWFWKSRTKEERELLNIVLFKKYFSIDLNNIKLLLVSHFILKLYVLPLYSILSPSISLIIPYLVVKYQFNIHISIQSYFKLLKFIIPLKPSNFIPYTNSFSSYSIISIIFLLLYIYSFYSNITDLLKLFNIHQLIYKKLESIQKLLYYVKKLSIILNIKNDRLQFSSLHYLEDFKNYYNGECLYFYNLFINNHKPILEDILVHIGKLDHTFSIFLLIKKIKLFNYPVCFSNIIKNNCSENHLKMMDFWNIQLFQKNPVFNSLELGKKYRKNIILTGPNAGGKTTLIKAIFYNLVLSHLYGFSCSENYISNEYTYLFSHINKIDKIDKYSLFQSEVRHFNEIINNINLFPNYFGVMDELFTSTTPEEGASCAYALADYIGNQKGIIIVTTHFKILSILEFNNPHFFNISMGYKNNQFNYKAEPGDNHVHIALELLNTHKYTKLFYNSSKNMLDYILSLKLDYNKDFKYSYKNLKNE